MRSTSRCLRASTASPSRRPAISSSRARSSPTAIPNSSLRPAAAKPKPTPDAQSPGHPAGAFYFKGDDTNSVLYHRNIFQQRNHPEDDHDDTADLFGPAVDRQQV